MQKNILVHKLTAYLNRPGTTTAYDGETFTAEFPGTLAAVQNRMQGTLRLVLGEPPRVATAYYQDLVNRANDSSEANDPYDWGYCTGQEVPWQHAAHFFTQPVIIHHHPRAMRPQAVPNRRNGNITESADLIFPNVGVAMQGCETTPNGTRRARLSIHVPSLDAFAELNR
jgi:aspartyl/asparaginyl-tRNA synthetase